MKLIYCAAGSRYYIPIALENGFLIGARLDRPNQVLYHPPYFTDQNFKQPNRVKYVLAVTRWAPTMASVLDWERPDQLPEVLRWAFEVSWFVQQVMIIPKVPGGIADIPREVNGRPVILGYSVASGYAKTDVPTSEFKGWPVHLLGGSPHEQLRLCDQMNVVSIDGNMHQKLANKCRYWSSGEWLPLGDRWSGPGANYEAFRLSCANIREAFAHLM